MRELVVAGAWITVMWLGPPELRPGPGSRDMNALDGRHLSTIASTGEEPGRELVKLQFGPSAPGQSGCDGGGPPTAVGPFPL